jgi:hypothetical protein
VSRGAVDPKVRSIRLGNAAFRNKVGRCQGGVEVLESCGFVRTTTTGSGIGGGSGNAGDEADDSIVLPKGDGNDYNQQLERLISARHLLALRAVQALGMDERDLPAYKGPPPKNAAAADAADAAAFDPYRTHSYNVQAAAAAAGGAAGGGEGISRTEKELHALKSKQERLERRLQKLGPGGRALAAFRPGGTGGTGGTGGGGSSSSSGSVAASLAPDDHPGTGTARGDGSLLASRMKRLEDERRQREEGGFTTRAMRDLESMKKARVYSHAALRIGFADGCWLNARFLPSETVGTVKAVLREECFREDVMMGGDGDGGGDGGSAPALDFDLYVAPPRRRLDEGKRLDAEGLVPAARVHVSWKVGGMPPPPARGQLPGSYLREELFRNGGSGGAGEATDFPSAQKLVDDDDAAGKAEEGGKKRPAAGNGARSAAGTSAESREEVLMARMLGQRPGLLGGSNKKSSGGGGKPKWFK